VRLGVAMSGGVDSSVCAALLLEQGHEVRGYFMELPLPEAEERWRRACLVAEQLHLPLCRVDLRQAFQSRVIEPFLAAWRAGLTPNPCVVCNGAVKFGALLDAVLADDREAMATGHYVRLARDAAGRMRLRRARDSGKDQSYFLCRIPEQRLRRLLFPLGEMSKAEVRQRATELGLTPAGESQDVCFLAGTSVADFLAAQGEAAPPGRIVSVDGRDLGPHQGIHHYTIGQRRGLGLPDASPWYVLRLEAEPRRVVVGKAGELFVHGLRLRDLDWRGSELPWRGQLRLRSRQQPCETVLQSDERGGWLVRCEVPQRAVTPGQFAVMYDGELVAGSGEIACPLAERE